MTKRKVSRELIHVRRKLRSISEAADTLANVVHAVDEKMIHACLSSLDDDLTTVRHLLKMDKSRPKPKPTPEPTKLKVKK